VFLNAIFLDHLDADLDHLERINDIVRAQASGALADLADASPAHEPMRQVRPMVVYPSEDLALVALSFEQRMPYLVRRILDGLGTPDQQSADLLSYLMFDRGYTRALVDLGYRDAAKRGAELEAFLKA
jgi:NTE family protein